MPESVKNKCGYCAIVGRPNVGKSTLLNRLVGQKLAITSHKPQTTRHSILGVKNMPGGQVIYVDTPGLHLRGEQAMNRYLNRTAKASLTDVDILLFVVEALVWTDEDEAVLKMVSQQNAPAILVVNKIDLVKDKAKLLPYIEGVSEKHDFHMVVPLSAMKGGYAETLESNVLERLPQNDNFFPEDQLTDRSERFFAAELIREQLTRRYAKEIPYALTVEIEKFEDDGKLYRIHALIWVEREGQKRIIIGDKGKALKEVGTFARLEMEKLFGQKVFLQLWVKIKKSWSSDESALANLGYTD